MDTIIEDILKDIIAQTHFYDRLAVLLTCKRFHKIAKEVFDPSRNNDAAIIYSSKNGQLESVKYLLKDPRVNPTAKRNCSIIYASAHGYLEIVKELLKDPRVQPQEDILELDALDYACKNGYLEIVKVLLKDPRVDPTVGGSYCLSEACQWDQLEIVKELLKDGRVNTADRYQQAFFYAVGNNNAKMVSALLDHGQVDAGYSGNDAIKTACDKGYWSVAQVLLNWHREPHRKRKREDDEVVFEEEQ